MDRIVLSLLVDNTSGVLEEHGSYDNRDLTAADEIRNRSRDKEIGRASCRERV